MVVVVTLIVVMRDNDNRIQESIELLSIEILVFIGIDDVKSSLACEIFDSL